MLDTINVNKGLVTDIYKGSEKIWAMPTCEIVSIVALSGSRDINIIVYPLNRSDVSITFTTFDKKNFVSKIIFKDKKTTNQFGHVIFRLPFYLERSTSFEVGITHTGFKSISRYRSVE